MSRQNFRTMDFSKRVLEEQYGDLSNFGIGAGPISPELFGKMGRAVLTIAGADGEISPREISFMLGFARSAGAPPQALEAFRAFDYKHATIETFLDASTRPLVKVILYQAIRVARCDGFAAKERAMAVRGAKALGLDPAIVPQIEALCAMEDGVRQARLSVVWPDTVPNAMAPTPDMLANDYWSHEQFGANGKFPPHVAPIIGKSILTIAGADGDLTETELAWFYGMGHAFGVPQEVIEDVMKFDYRGSRIEEVFTVEARPFARVILYDAVRCAASDGFAEKERNMARRAAKALGVDASIVPWIEGVISLEHSVRAARIKLLSPA